MEPNKEKESYLNEVTELLELSIKDLQDAIKDSAAHIIDGNISAGHRARAAMIRARKCITETRKMIAPSNKVMQKIFSKDSSDSAEENNLSEIPSIYKKSKSPKK